MHVCAKYVIYVRCASFVSCYACCVLNACDFTNKCNHYNVTSRQAAQFATTINQRVVHAVAYYYMKKSCLIPAYFA